MEYEREFRKQIWVLRNPRKPLPNSAEAKRRTQKLKQAEKESAERKRLLRLLKKKAVKAAKKEADKDGRDEAKKKKKKKMSIFPRWVYLLLPQGKMETNV